MPYVTASPRGLRNGEIITEFTDTTNTTSVTYTYPLQQSSLSVENSGVADIYVTVGKYTNQVINPNKTWRADVVFTAFSIRSDANSQEFIATSFQYDLEGNEAVDLIARATAQRSVDTLKNIRAKLENPFIKTRIKLIGDSITAGQGGTGYSATGEAMYSTYKSNILTATCWANSLYNAIDKKYNKEHYVELTNPNLFVPYPVTKDTNAKMDTKIDILNPYASGRAMKFRFYGDHFTIVYAVITNAGILDIYVDSVKWGELDATGAPLLYSQEKLVNGLTLGYHDVEIRETGRKSAGSANTRVYVEGLKIPKTAVVKNWGISGINNRHVNDDRASMITSADDVFIMQMGVNDRQNLNVPSASKYYLREHIKYIQSLGADVILMSANAVSVANDTDVTKNFRMEDVDVAVRQVAEEFNIPFISNYQAIINHARETGVTIDSLLSDGLHPNDAGYDVMFKNIIKQLGLPILRDGVTY